METGTKKARDMRFRSTTSKALDDEGEGEVQLGYDDSGPRDSGSTGANGKRQSLGGESFVPYVDVKADLMEANITNLTSSYRSSIASQQSARRGKEKWQPSRTQVADATSSLTDDSNGGGTPTHATPRVLTATPPSPLVTSMDILVDGEGEPKKMSLLKRVSSQLSTSSYSLDEPLSQVSIAIFSICFLFVVVACTVIVYSCGTGPCNETDDTEAARNRTVIKTPTSTYGKASGNNSGHVNVLPTKGL